MGKIKGWWFGPENNRLSYDDGREVAVGVEHTVCGIIIPCANGLHLSKLMTDAFFYSRGPVVWRVEGSGRIVPHGNPINKYACSHRRYINGGIDVTETLRKFARMCALDVVHLWDAPDIVVQYLKTGDEAIMAEARYRARGAARDINLFVAFKSAAWAAAKAADCSGLDVTRDSVECSCRAAAKAKPWDALTDIEYYKQNRRLTAMVSAAIRNHSS